MTQMAKCSRPLRKLALVIIPLLVVLTLWRMNQPSVTLTFLEFRVVNRSNVPDGVRCAVLLMENPGNSSLTYFSSKFWPCTYIRETDAPTKPLRDSAYPHVIETYVIDPGERIEIQVPLYYYQSSTAISKPCRIGVHIRREASGVWRDAAHWLRDQLGLTFNVARDSIIWSEVITP